MTYQQLDAIADGINPVLAVLTLILPFAIRPASPYTRGLFFLGTAISMAAMYAIGWLDQLLGIWATLQLDYSSHTGFAAVLLVSLSIWNRKLILPSAVVLLSYVALMLYQKYHSIVDILTTAVIIVPLTTVLQLIVLGAYRRLRVTTAHSH
jgi:hypothetical protein